MITHRYTSRPSYARSLKDRLRGRARAPARARRPRPRVRRRAQHAPPEALAAGRSGQRAARARARGARRGDGEEQGAGDDLRDAPGARRAVGTLDRIVASSCSPACRTGATAPRPRASRRSRSSRCSSSATREPAAARRSCAAARASPSGLGVSPGRGYAVALPDRRRTCPQSPAGIVADGTVARRRRVIAASAAALRLLGIGGGHRGELVERSPGPQVVEDALRNDLPRRSFLPL